MNKSVWAGVLVWIGLMAAAWWWIDGRDRGQAEAPAFDRPVVVDSSMAHGAPPEIRHPIPQPDPPPVVERDGEDAADGASAPAAPPALPTLKQSDGPVIADLGTLADRAPLEAMLIPDRFIEKLVLTVHSLDGEPLPVRFRPVRHTRGLLVTQPDADTYTLSADNAARYDQAVSLFTSIEPSRLVDLYFRYYPLLQEAFVNLGETRHVYFNDRVIDTIDHLLAAPSVEQPVVLTRPKILYRFADAELEALSVGQKTLIRIGPDHAARVKQQLKAIRDEILSRSG